MSADRIVRQGSAWIQHGTHSDRVYLMKPGSEPVEGLLDRIEALAAKEGYGKIFAKLPASGARRAADRGFVEEARIPGYFRRAEDAVFMSRFLDPRRSDPGPLPERPGERDRKAASEPALPEGFRLRRARLEDTAEMAALFRGIFPSYPFPVHDPAYLESTMAGQARYFLAEREGRIAALATGEIDGEALAAEMTDFATLPDCRGQGLAAALLRLMETELVREDGILTACTIARAVSESVNRLFAGAGYAFGGTLVNNTQIGGAIESMQVWHKPLPRNEKGSARAF